MAEKKKVLIGSPIHQKPQILQAFLNSLKQLRQDTIEITVLFVDDNESLESKQLLQQFADEMANVVIHVNDRVQEYVCNDHMHMWSETLIWKVARFKNMMIQMAKEYEFDYLFLVDSDLLLHPNLIQHLIETGKDIISEVFWTSWQPGIEPQPQVWLTDQYTQYAMARNESLTNEEKLKRYRSFIEQLSEPGVFEVGGLGACTLISRQAILAGVNFNEIRNITFWGEDRHFCIRAAALGFSLYVDTHYPAYHIYRESDLAGIPNYLQENAQRDVKNMQWYVCNSVQKGMEMLGTFRYNRTEQPQWQPFFTEPLRQELTAQAQADLEKNRAARLAVEAKVSNTLVTSLDIERGTAYVRFVLCNNGMEEGRSFYEQFLCEAMLERRNGSWQIGAFQVLEQQAPAQVPPVRYAKDRQNKLTLSMIVKNEADRYLREVLEAHRQYIDEAVIIDDGSTDNTVAIIEEVLQGIPLHIVRNPVSKFSNEYELRTQQWEETLKTNPDWILNLDADEVFEQRMRDEVRNLINQQEFDVVCFRLYDMWDAEHYRDDQYWQAHKTYRPFLVRYQPEFPYRFKQTAQHCGRLPENVLDQPVAGSPLRLKHLGWARQEDRVTKYKRYQQLDPDAQFGWKEQYESILDEHPNLVQWKE